MSTVSPPCDDAAAAGVAAAAAAATAAVAVAVDYRNDAAIDYHNVSWNDITEDDKETPIEITGVLWEKLSSQQLRVVCSQLSVKGVKNAKKSDMVEKICTTFSNKRAYMALIQEGKEDNEPNTTRGGTAPRKEVQCTFRLINILFSDEFADAFASLGNVADRQLLDSGRAGNDEHFWVGVHGAFVESHPDYDLLEFELSDDIFLAQDHIDPGKIVPHSWKKLRTLWKGVNADYKAALARFTLSGTHDQSFYNFCNGKLDVYYLRKKLEIKPNLNDTVEADLPEECALTSDTAFVPTGTDGTPSSISSKSRKKPKGMPNMEVLAEAIRDLGSSKMQSELAKHKVQCMTQEDARREKESLENSRKLRFDEWERIQANLRALRVDLKIRYWTRRREGN